MSTRSYSQLPDEIWVNILSYVDEPKSLQSCSQAFETCARILDPSSSKWKTALIFDMLQNFLSKEDVFNFRLVCKMWCKSVDNHLEGQYINECFDGRHMSTLSPKVVISGPLYARCLQDAGRAFRQRERFEAMREHPKNPLLGKGVVIPYFDEGKASMLAEIGHHILHMQTFGLSYPFETFDTDFCQSIRSVLEHVPNLKTITLKVSIVMHPNLYKELGSLDSKQLWEEKRQLLLEYMKNNPTSSGLPILSNLRICGMLKVKEDVVWKMFDSLL